MRFFDNVKTRAELDQLRQEINLQINEQYREARKRLQDEAPKFKKARIIPITGMITANDMYGLFAPATDKSPRSPLLVINSQNQCNY